MLGFVVSVGVWEGCELGAADKLGSMEGGDDGSVLMDGTADG